MPATIRHVYFRVVSKYSSRCLQYLDRSNWSSPHHRDELSEPDNSDTKRVTSTHNLCFGAKIRKIGIPLQTPVFLYKSGVQGGIYCTDMFSDAFQLKSNARRTIVRIISKRFKTGIKILTIML